MRTLVAEGDLASARRIKVAIEPQGFVVETAECGEDGLELLKIYDFDIALIGRFCRTWTEPSCSAGCARPSSPHPS